MSFPPVVNIKSALAVPFIVSFPVEPVIILKIWLAFKINPSANWKVSTLCLSDAYQFLIVNVLFVFFNPKTRLFPSFVIVRSSGVTFFPKEITSSPASTSSFETSTQTGYQSV